MSAGQPAHLLTMLEFLQAEGAHTVISFVDVRDRFKGLRGGHRATASLGGRCRRRWSLRLRPCRSQLLLRLLLLLLNSLSLMVDLQLEQLLLLLVMVSFTMMLVP